jgi:hypothetical protein
MDQYRMIEGKDVSDFFSGFSNMLRRAILLILKAVKTYFIASLIVFLLVAGYSIYKWNGTKKLYRSEMVCEFNNLSKKVYGEMVQRLDILARTQSYNALASYLKLPVEKAKEIVSIEGTNMEGSLLREDITTTRSPMYFKVIATSNNVFAPLQDALLDYLNSNSPYRLQRNVMENERIAHKVAFVKTDIALVDTALMAYISSFRNITSHADTSYRLSNIPNLINYKRTLEEELLGQEWRTQEIKSSVELLFGFTPPDNPTQESNKSLVTSFVLAFVLAIFTALLLWWLRAGKTPTSPPVVTA